MKTMAFCSKYLARVIKYPISRNLSTAARVAQVQEEPPQYFRTKESNPENHRDEHVSRFYTIPSEDTQILFSHGLHKEYQKQSKTFGELSILIRKPALELLTYLSQADYTKPANRFIIYGRHGCGKTTTLLHALHYGFSTRKIIVHVHYAQLWFRNPKEISNSTSREGFIDLPIDAATWLLNFKNLNSSILSEKDLRLSKTYEWSSRESSAEGSPLTEMIDLGISRIKYACDIVIALMNELKQASTAGRCQMLVAIDGYNAFYSQYSLIKDDNKQRVPPSRISLTLAFKEITKSDWSNGQVVVTVDQRASKDIRESHLPRYLLTKEGFEHMDPFLPIVLENYSEDEFDTVIDYYKNRKWVRNLAPEAQTELKLLTGRNPELLMRYCRDL